MYYRDYRVQKSGKDIPDPHGSGREFSLTADPSLYCYCIKQAEPVLEANGVRRSGEFTFIPCDEKGNLLDMRKETCWYDNA